MRTFPSCPSRTATSSKSSATPGPPHWRRTGEYAGGDLHRPEHSDAPGCRAADIPVATSSSSPNCARRSAFRGREATTDPLPSEKTSTAAFYAALLQKADYAWLASRLRFDQRPPDRPGRTCSDFSETQFAAQHSAIGLIAGLLLAAGWVMLQEQHRDVVRVPGDAGACLALPELGAIPQAGGWTPPAFVSYGFAKGELRIQRLALEQRAELSEPFRAIAASILSSGLGGGQARLLVVTSCQPIEGKTTVVSNLGIALAAIGQKVLMIDADMHRPRLHKLFDEANSWGLSDVLSEKNAIDELPLDVLAKKTSVPHLYLLPSGASTDNIFGLLHSGRMTRLLPLFREEFDYVLVDAPPCLEFADARIMARYAEKLLLVVRANYTDRRTAQTAVERLRLDGTAADGRHSQPLAPQFRPLIRLSQRPARRFGRAVS